MDPNFYYEAVNSVGMALLFGLVIKYVRGVVKDCRPLDYWHKGD